MKAKIIIPASVISVLLANAPSSYAHDFPSKPVRIVVPFPPGGSADTVTRMLGQSLCERWKQPVVIENKAGASGMIGTSQVARSSADGYTLVMASGGSQAINVGLFNKIAYDPIRDFSPVALTAILPLLMVAPANAPYSSVQDFITWAKSSTTPTNYCSIGPGSPSHLAGELFIASTKLDLTHIPYKGSGPALVDAIAGFCNVIFDSALSSGPHVRNGKLKVLAVGTEQRMPSWAQIPTVSESGIPGFSAYSWLGLFAPAGTPDNIVETVNRDVGAILNSSQFKEKLELQGAIPGKGSPTDLGKFLGSEISKWSALIKQRGITAD